MAQWHGKQPIQVLTFELQGEMFALDALAVREIVDLIPITEVPNATLFVGGLINVRGKVVPLADLRIAFDMAPTAATVDTRIVVLEIDLDDEATTVAIRADKVHEVTELAPASLEETPRLGLTWRPDFIRCVGKRADEFITVLDLLRIFTVALEDTRTGPTNIQGAGTAPIQLA